jgi:hypothetical protein
MRYEPVGDRRPPVADARIHVADAPVPLPVVAKGSAELRDRRESMTQALFTGRRLVDVTLALPELPGLPDGSGTLVDLEYADRLSDSFDNTARLEVWLRADAPSDLDSLLRERGVVVIGEETIAQRTARYRSSGSALGEALRLAAGAAGILLTALALLVIAATDRRRRLGELASLRQQGIAVLDARRARGGFGIVVACAVPVGMVAGLLAARLTRAAGASAVSAGAMVLLATAVLGTAAILANRGGGGRR